MNRHWRLQTDNDGIAWLHFNQAESSVNLLSQETLDEFAEVLARLEKLTLNGLVILSDKPGGFIAGADVKGFLGTANPQDVVTHIQDVHRLFQRLGGAALPQPGPDPWFLPGRRSGLGSRGIRGYPARFS